MRRLIVKGEKSPTFDSNGFKRRKPGWHLVTPTCRVTKCHTKKIISLFHDNLEIFLICELKAKMCACVALNNQPDR